MLVMLYMLVVLKIPIIAIIVLVFWAMKDSGSSDEGGGTKKQGPDPVCPGGRPESPLYSLRRNKCGITGKSDERVRSRLR